MKGFLLTLVSMVIGYFFFKNFFKTLIVLIPIIAFFIIGIIVTLIILWNYKE